MLVRRLLTCLPQSSHPASWGRSQNELPSQLLSTLQLGTCKAALPAPHRSWSWAPHVSPTMGKRPCELGAGCPYQVRRARLASSGTGSQGVPLAESARPPSAPERILARQASAQSKVGYADRQGTQAHRWAPLGQRLDGNWCCGRRRRSSCCSHDGNEAPSRRQESRSSRGARARRRGSRQLRRACCSCCGCSIWQGGGEAVH